MIYTPYIGNGLLLHRYDIYSLYNFISRLLFCSFVSVYNHYNQDELSRQTTYKTRFAPTHFASCSSLMVVSYFHLMVGLPASFYKNLVRRAHICMQYF
jgi:hypothetical protein